MAADLNVLVPGFRGPVVTTLKQCADRGVEMRPNATVRAPLEQAKLWRQSRSINEIQAKIDELNAADAPFLASCLQQAGPQHGDPVTNSIPGLSWHQWAEALDCFWVVDGKAEWSTTKKVNGLNGYHVYAEEAVALGLTAGGLFKSIKDWPHVQLQAAGSPLKVHTLVEIDREMRKRFGT
jgi:peptidoglycan L-alanyl-D-glutamate endopeptidase CwlK